MNLVICLSRDPLHLVGLEALFGLLIWKAWLLSGNNYIWLVLFMQLLFNFYKQGSPYWCDWEGECRVYWWKSIAAASLSLCPVAVARCSYSAKYMLKSNCVYFCIWMDAGASRCKLSEGDSLAIITCISEPRMTEVSRWEQPSIICLASTVFTAWPQKQPSCLSLEGKHPTFCVFVDLRTCLLSGINRMQSQVGIDADCIQLWFGFGSYIQLHKLSQRQLNCPRFICVCAES